jgi:hypothetical protein
LAGGPLLSKERFITETAGVRDPYAPSGEPLPPGSPTGDAAIPASEFITEEFVSECFALPGNMIARKTGEDFWLIPDEEKELLGKGATPAVKAWLQNVLDGPETPQTLLLATLLVVYGPRVARQIIISSLRARGKMQPKPQPSPKTNQPPAQSNDSTPETAQMDSSMDYAQSSESEVAESQPRPFDWQGLRGEP